MLGVLRGTKDLSGETAETLAATAGSVVKATADVGGDVAGVAKAAVEGAILGAREIGVDTAEAASAAASGASGRQAMSVQLFSNKSKRPRQESSVA